MRSMTSVLLIVQLTTTAFCTVEPEIPFPNELDGAAIRVDRLDSILDYALIIGNGDINALVYQEKQKVVMRLTKNDVWDARLITENDPPLPKLSLLKDLGHGDWPDRKWIVPKDFIRRGADSYHSESYPCPRSCGAVEILLPADSAGLPDNALKGFLDLRRGYVEIYSAASGEPVITIRALAQSNAFFIQTAYAVQLQAVTSKDLPDPVCKTEGVITWLSQQIPGDLDWPGMGFSVALARGEKVNIVALATSRESGDFIGSATGLAKDTLSQAAEPLIHQHQAEWERFWSASGIDISDANLEKCWYRGLYFLRCVSKPGVVSVGLFAGLIDDAPAWHGDYHTNYNIQQTYWGCLAANHVELIEPYVQLIQRYLPRGQWLAKEIFNCRGSYYPHVMYAYEPEHPEQCRSRNRRQFIDHVWGMTLGVTGFTVQPLWWAYRYQPSREFLERDVYPSLREAARFYLDYMDQCERSAEGRVVLGPSVSPEHWGWTDQFERNRNGTFDIAMVRYCFEATIEAAGVLGCDATLADECRRSLALLPDYPVNTTEREEPFVVDVEGAPSQKYNIAAPATPVFPGDVITRQSPRDEISLFRRTIEGLKWNGNNSLVMLGVARARLGIADTADWLNDELAVRLRPNGTYRLNPKADHRFNSRGHYTEQFGATMAVSELLLQSVGDVIRVFPAWPEGESARFFRLRTQGGFLVSAERDEDRITRLEVVSTAGGTCRLLNPWPGQAVRCQRDGASFNPSIDDQEILNIETQPGERLVFQAAASN